MVHTKSKPDCLSVQYYTQVVLDMTAIPEKTSRADLPWSQVSSGHGGSVWKCVAHL